MAEIKRIPRQRVADEVYRIIRQAILDRDFRPGERLDIPALAERFDVSQMPVRQAIHRLSGAGLVEIRPRSGTFVAKLTAKEVANTFSVRRALECLAAEAAVYRVKPADVRKLRDIIDQIRDLPRDPSGRERHDKLNSLFHRTIVGLADNQKLEAIYDDLHAHIKIARIHVHSADWADRVDQETAEHAEIVSALERQDAAALTAALSRHIDRARQALSADLDRPERHDGRRGRDAEVRTGVL